jgi:hypothetical protein
MSRWCLTSAFAAGSERTELGVKAAGTLSIGELQKRKYKDAEDQSDNKALLVLRC